MGEGEWRPTPLFTSDQQMTSQTGICDMRLPHIFHMLDTTHARFHFRQKMLCIILVYANLD